jgi:hypothetical protein
VAFPTRSTPGSEPLIRPHIASRALDELRMGHPLLCGLRGLRVVGCWRSGGFAQWEPHAQYLKPAIWNAVAAEPVAHTALADSESSGKGSHTASGPYCVVEFVHSYGLYHSRDF